MLLVMSTIVSLMMIDLLLPDSALNLPQSFFVTENLVFLFGGAI